MRPMPSRSLIPLLALLAVLCGCGATRAAGQRADPHLSTGSSCTPVRGDSHIGDALVHVPRGARAPLPLVVAFHGARGDGDAFADESGLSRPCGAPSPGGGGEGDPFAEEGALPLSPARHGFAVLYPTAGSSRRFW